MQKKITLSLLAILCSQLVLAEEMGEIPTVNVPNSVEMRANPQSGLGMRSVQSTMPTVTNAKGPQPIGNLQKNQSTNDSLNTVLSGSVELTEEQRLRAKEKAFKQQMETTFPMTEDQIRRFNGKVENLDKAYRQSTNPVPNYVPAEVSVNFGVKTEMPVVMLGANSIFDTSLVFVDSTGSPWEIETYNVAKNKEFFATFPDEIKGNILSLKTTAPYGVTSLTVNLKNAPSPLIFQLVTGQPEVYSLFKVNVDTVGPNAPTGTRFENLSKGFDDNNKDLDELLTVTVPKGLKQLSLTGFNVDNSTFAWASRDGQYIYVRSPMKVNAPMVIDGGRIGGTNDYIYQLKRSNFISFAYKGRDVMVRVSGLPVYAK